MDERNEELNSAPDRLDELQLMRFMEGRLDSTEQSEVQACLQRSPEDRRTLDALREEARLLREAAENLSEPPLKIGEKVITVLRAEHRRRVALDRARRFRNRLIALTATAALLLVGLYFLSPREEAGRILSGTAASVARGNGTPTPLPKGSLIYDNDTLITGRGQFVRLGLNSTCRVDVDEDSRVKIDKGAASLITVESGRARISTEAVKHSALVRTAYGHIRVEQETEFEFWLVTPREVRWPSWTEPWKPAGQEPPAPASLACVTVFKGTVYIHTNDHPKGFPVSAGRRVTFTARRLPVEMEEFDDWEALDSRREPWHGLDGVSPPGLSLLDLYPPFDWKDLGERTGLLSDQLPGGAHLVDSIKEAFDVLARAQQLEDAAARALQLSEGQQALRTATQGLPLSSELRWLGRAIEGLAHFERGRCLEATGTEGARGDAAGAFLAASVAFREALSGSQQDLKTDATVAPGLGELAAPKLTVSSRLRDLTPVEQGMLLARFYLPWALQANAHLAEPDSEADSMAREPLAPLFAQAAGLMDLSVEGLAARYGRALALFEEGHVNEALELFAGLRSYSVAGLPDPVRAYVEGLRQAAHVASIRIYASRGEWDKVADVLDQFHARYPLPLNSPATEQMEAIQAEAVRAAAEAAFQRKEWTVALNQFDVLLRPADAETRLTPPVFWAFKLKQLEAALAAGRGVESTRLARLVRRDGAAHLSAADLARAMELGKQAEDLFHKQREERKTRATDSIQLDMNE